MSATPKNGKEADFQLFMGLLDADRFEGRFREGVHKANVSDMIRRLTKEELYRFDGTPLFPEHRVHRDYSMADVHRLRLLQRARSLGFSVDECRQLLSLYHDKDRESADVKALAAEAERHRPPSPTTCAWAPAW